MTGRLPKAVFNVLKEIRGDIPTTEKEQNASKAGPSGPCVSTGRNGSLRRKARKIKLRPRTEGATETDYRKEV